MRSNRTSPCIAAFRSRSRDNGNASTARSPMKAVFPVLVAPADSTRRVQPLAQLAAEQRHRPEHRFTKWTSAHADGAFELVVDRLSRHRARNRLTKSRNVLKTHDDIEWDFSFAASLEGQSKREVDGRRARSFEVKCPA